MKFLIILALLQAFQVCLASRILFLIPMPMKSHYALGDRLIRKLVGRGHHVTLISPFKMADPPKNFTEIVIPETSRLLTSKFEILSKPLTAI